MGAYHKLRPLSPEELVVLFPLMCARLAVSVIISAKRRAIDPTRTSWFVSEERAWKKLIFFATLPPADAAIKLASKTDITLYQERGESVSP